MGLQGPALLKVWGHHGHGEEQGTLLHNQTSVTVDGRGVSVFIQTDKPVYRPQHRGGWLAWPWGRGTGDSRGLELSHACPLFFVFYSSANQCLHRVPRPEAGQQEGGISFESWVLWGAEWLGGRGC
jgi:hypothetical protein